jgi:preprotein translocase subunit YajC
MTTSGLRATVVDASYEETIDLEIADGVVTTWVRASVREKVNPIVEESEPVVADDDAADDLPDTAPSLKKDDSANGTPRN